MQQNNETTAESRRDFFNPSQRPQKMSPKRARLLHCRKLSSLTESGKFVSAWVKLRCRNK